MFSWWYYFKWTIKSILKVVLGKKNRHTKTNFPGLIETLLMAALKNAGATYASSLWKHAYSNILKISPPKTESFPIKVLIFFIFLAQNVDCEYSLEPPRRSGSNEYPQSMFLSRNNKNNVKPCKPQFYYIKVGFKGGQNYIGFVFVMYFPPQPTPPLFSSTFLSGHFKVAFWTIQ